MIIETGTRQEFKRCVTETVIALRWRSCGHVVVIDALSLSMWGGWYRQRFYPEDGGKCAHEGICPCCGEMSVYTFST